MPFKKGETPKGAIPFTKGKSGNPAGKPPKIFTAITTEMRKMGHTGLKQAHVIEAYELLIGLPHDQLTRIANDSTLPMLLRICSKSILSKSGFDVIERMLDRVHGKAKQQTDITSRGESIAIPKPDLSKLTKDELQQFIELSKKVSGT